MKKVPLILLLLIAVTANLSIAQVKKTQTKPAVKSTTNTVLKSAMQRGKLVYSSLCIACHQADAGGVPGLNPPLVKTSYVLGDKRRLISILLNGLQGEEIDGEEYANVMPPVNHLTNQQIADVLTYIRNSFGNKASLITAAEVNEVRKRK